jgi:hypothetical protein
MLSPSNDWIPAAWAAGRPPGRVPLPPGQQAFSGSHRVSYGYNGMITHIDGKRVDYGYDGRIKSIDGESVSYSYTGRMDRVGDKEVYTDPFGFVSF